MNHQLKATDRGTLVHLFLELYPLDKELNFEECFSKILYKDLYLMKKRELF